MGKIITIGGAGTGGGGTTSPLTTKGDLYTFDTDNQRLGVGTNGQILSSDSEEATGLKWIDNIITSNFVTDLIAANWVLDTGTTYYQDVTHNLGSEAVAIEVYDSVTKETVIPQEITRTGINAVRIYVEGNTNNLTVLVQSNTQNTLNPTLTNFVFVGDKICPE